MDYSRQQRRVGGVEYMTIVDEVGGVEVAVDVWLTEDGEGGWGQKYVVPKTDMETGLIGGFKKQQK